MSVRITPKYAIDEDYDGIGGLGLPVTCRAPAEVISQTDLSGFSVDKVVDYEWVSSVPPTNKTIIEKRGEEFIKAGAKIVLTESGEYAVSASLNKPEYPNPMGPDVAVTFYHVTIENGIPAVPQPAAAEADAASTSSDVLVNGKPVLLYGYNIDGHNYFKLRDLAYVLNGTAKQFEVAWDGDNDAILLTSGAPYTPDGSELGKAVGGKKATLTSSKILLDGGEVTFTAYNIDGNNYFQLRDIAKTFDFGVGWDDSSNTVSINADVGYTE